MSDYDRVEYGDSGLVSLPDGGFYNKYTKETITEDGVVFNEDGELVYSPYEEEEDD